MHSTPKEDRRSTFSLGFHWHRLSDSCRIDRRGKNHMERDVSARVHKWVIHAVVASIVVPLSWFLVWFTLPLSAPIHWFDDNTFIPTVANAGDTIAVKRHHVVSEAFRGDIVRRMVKRDGDKVIAVYLEPVTHFFEAGDNTYFRPFKIPCELTPGDWDLVTTISYIDQFNRVRSLTPPVLHLQIVMPCIGEQKNV